MNDNSMTSCVISYACVGCYSGFFDESVGLLDLLSPEHICTKRTHTNDKYKLRYKHVLYANVLCILKFSLYENT